DRLMFIGFAPVVAISAKSGKNLGSIWKAVTEAYANFSQSITTSRLNTWLQGIRDFGHTVSSGRKILRIKYVTQIGTCPPQFVFFANHPEMVDENYKRYLENRLRSSFELVGTPLRLKFKRKD
ncbi:MAG: ribosome biogenesis GTPase Der, partial [Eggerthellaceae bacterium]|nr:ribosome biogenesis GTPase Der [Eggerthellaceae bacterium]